MRDWQNRGTNRTVKRPSLYLTGQAETLVFYPQTGNYTCGFPGSQAFRLGTNDAMGFPGSLVWRKHQVGLLSLYNCLSYFLRIHHCIHFLLILFCGESWPAKGPWVSQNFLSLELIKQDTEECMEECSMPEDSPMPFCDSYNLWKSIPILKGNYIGLDAVSMLYTHACNWLLFKTPFSIDSVQLLKIKIPFRQLLPR